MAEIHKIEKNGVTIYPATTTDAVVVVWHSTQVVTPAGTRMVVW